MLGTATIVKRDDGRFDYHEQGRLTLANGQTLDAERRYVFAPESDGFAVFFAATPPRLFHRIALRLAGPHRVGEARHFCGGDRYDSRYEFDPDDRFAIRHAVAGPRKHYTMTTRYLRAEGDRR